MREEVLSAEDRLALGRRRRNEVPLETHSQVPDGDPHCATGILIEEDAGRDAALLAGRYERLLASPFTFLRGSAAVMAADLATSPSSGLNAQLCGDAHVANFGVFATPERRLVFDINDFDETTVGPFEWDLKRLTASVVIVGLQNGHSHAERERAVLSTARSYREAMLAFSEQSTLAVWYRTLEVDALLAHMSDRMTKAERKTAERTARKAVERGQRKALRLTEGDGASRRFISQPPDLIRLEDLHVEAAPDAVWAGIQEVFDQYLDSVSDDRRELLRWFTLRDAARKAVGVGSYGLGAYVLLLTGPRENDILVLQAKEARASAVAAYLPGKDDPNGGRRVVYGQRRIQAAGDAFLGWQERGMPGGGVTYSYIRQFRDGKLSADVDGMDDARLAVYGQLCGWTLAKAHARSGDRFAIAGYLGHGATFDEALSAFAEKYAHRVEQQLSAVRSDAPARTAGDTS